MKESQYNLLCEKLINLRIEYKSNPSEELRDRIYLIDSKLKDIDRQIGKFHRR